MQHVLALFSSLPFVAGVLLLLVGAPPKVRFSIGVVLIVIALVAM
jgi:hypothetical protein